MATPETSPEITKCLITDRFCPNVNSMGPGYEKVHGACQLGLLEDLGRTCGLLARDEDKSPSC